MGENTVNKEEKLMKRSKVKFLKRKGKNYIKKRNQEIYEGEKQKMKKNQCGKEKIKRMLKIEKPSKIHVFFLTKTNVAPQKSCLNIDQ